MTTPARRLVVAHPSPDLYGSDRQLLQSLTALRGDGWDILLVLPHDGPLVPLAREAGARVLVTTFPVLRKSLLHPARLLATAWRAVRSAIAAARLLRRGRADVLYVNTVTIPWWLVAGRLARVPAVLHVHEAEDDQGRLVATALNAPALLARTVLANSAAAARTMTRAVPRLEPRVTVVHNGVAAPPEAPRPREHVDGQPWQLVLVGRLSPRKGTDVALEAVGQLVDRGHDVRLAVCGSVFPGYEWFEDELRARAGRPDLDGRVELRGYVAPTWPALADADVVLVPSRTEPFGNTAVEAMLARRPVVASRVQGLAEVVTHERTGLLVEPGDPTALADAIERLLLDGTLRTQLADDAHREAHERFGVERYDSRVRELVRGVAK